MSRLLLDTEALIWWDADDRRLGRHARAAIQRAGEGSNWGKTVKNGLGARWHVLM